ncbi:hypothetical protein CB1_000526023 [Camelus ferus]|nr:hypothetical protein CB1_000526023 [Camelus ferus]
MMSSSARRQRLSSSTDFKRAQLGTTQSKQPGEATPQHSLARLQAPEKETGMQPKGEAPDTSEELSWQPKDILQHVCGSAAGGAGGAEHPEGTEPMQPGAGGRGLQFKELDVMASASCHPGPARTLLQRYAGEGRIRARHLESSARTNLYANSHLIMPPHNMVKVKSSWKNWKYSPRLPDFAMIPGSQIAAHGDPVVDECPEPLSRSGLIQPQLGPGLTLGTREQTGQGWNFVTVTIDLKESEQ